MQLQCIGTGNIEGNVCMSYIRVPYRILSWGGEQDDSRMIVVCETRVCLLGGLGACPPRKILNLHFLRSLLTQSGTKIF